MTQLVGRGFLSSWISRILRLSFHYLEKLPYLGQNIFAKSSAKLFFERIGLLTMSYWGIRLGYWLTRQLINAVPRNLTLRYGENSYAVVTGACNNIGQGFCEELSKAGFNLVLIDEDIDRLESLASRLKQAKATTQIKIVPLRSKDMLQERFFDDLYQQFRGLDISILVNNASLDVTREITATGNEELKKMVLLNTVPLVLLTRTAITNLRTRSLRSAIVNVSSHSATKPAPYTSCYSATKAFADFFTRGLAIEYPQLDIISFRPPLNKTLSSEGDVQIPNGCVRACLRQLGKERETSGGPLSSLENLQFDIKSAFAKPVSPNTSLDLKESEILMKK